MEEPARVTAMSEPTTPALATPLRKFHMGEFFTLFAS
jgi:hypothetical protein